MSVAAQVRDYVRRRRWIRTRVPDSSTAAIQKSAPAAPPTRPMQPDSIMKGGAGKKAERSDHPRLDPSPAPESPAAAPVSPGKRVRIADIEQPNDDNWDKGQRSLLTQALMSDEPSQHPDESAPSGHYPPEPASASDESARAPQRSMKSESHVSPARRRPEEAALAASPTGLHQSVSSGRSLSCPEDLQDPPGVDPEPSARDHPYNPHASVLSQLENTSPTLHIPGTPWLAVSLRAQGCWCTA